MEDESTPLNDPGRFVRAGILFYGAMAIVAVLWRVGGYNEDIGSPALAGAVDGPVPWSAFESLAAGAAIAGVVIGISWAATEWTGWGKRLSDQLADQLPSISVPDAVLLAFASGLAEEMFFRGALQPRAGLVAASVLFGVLHMPTDRALWPWTGFALAMGFVLGWLFEASGSLLGPIVAHTLINAVNLPLLVQRRQAESDRAGRESGESHD